MKMKIEETYCEAFEGLFVRLCVTAGDEKRLKRAAYSATALPCTVFGESEGGVEKWLNEGEGEGENETPDGRVGALVQVWVNSDSAVEVGTAKRLEYEVSKRIRQGVLVVPTTAVFNAFPTTHADGKIDTMQRVGHCGDGHETVDQRFGREVVAVPIMMGEFLVERYLGYGKGVMGGNLWFFCESLESALEAGEKAVAAVNGVEGAVAPFEICAAGSKPETKYPEIGPTTNHLYCPSLKRRLRGSESKVPAGVNFIPEVVINGVSLDAVREAMRAAVESVQDVKGVVKVSAGNYGGKLGRYKIYLDELLSLRKRGD
ncbi:MAG: formylmethanofuran--tetrahydromethanopterin formyltransferase [Candidatus Methanophagaceae archaeon]|nr:MAG: formylmethanofuran--tetrahydromethanopterin formyltransferase [Methanophagales archaeon]